MILIDTGPLVAPGNRAAQLVEQYADFPLGTTDATIVTIAERLEITTIATLDRRHFTAIRPRHIGTFTLLPEQR